MKNWSVQKNTNIEKMIKSRILDKVLSKYGTKNLYN